MSFRQFGGLKYASKHNVVSSNLNASNQLFVTQNVGQPNSIIDFLSDISGNITIYGNIDISGDENIKGNLTVDGNETVLGNVDISGNLDISGNATAKYMFLSSGTNYATQNNAVMPKSYIDLVAAGITVAGSVQVIANDPNNPVPINQNVTSGYSIDGITLNNGDYVLLNQQPDASQNGVYLYSNTNLNNYQFTRNTQQTILPVGSDAVGALVIVLNGNLYAKSGWLQTYKNPLTDAAIVGTDQLNFVEFYSLNFKTGNGLISTSVNDTTYISVDPSLNYMYAIDGSSNVLQLGTRQTTTGLNFGSQSNQIPISFNGNPYTYSPYSIGSVISPPTFTITATSNPNQITFTWPIPSGTSIPTSLQQLNAVLYANILVNGNNTIKTYPILQNYTSNLYINTLIISKFSNSSVPTNNTYFYYNSDFVNLTDSSSNILLLWYSNYGPYPNVSNVGYTTFQASGPPGPVLFGATIQTNFNSLTLPVYVAYTGTDANGNQLLGPPFITSYKINTYGTSGSTHRYPSAYSFQSGPAISIGNLSQTAGASYAIGLGFGTSNSSTSALSTAIYPDCSYNFNVQAFNGTSYGPPGTTSYYTVQPTYPNTTIPNPLFNSTNFKYSNTNAQNYYFVSDISANSPLQYDIINITSNNFPWISNQMTVPVQTQNNLGSTGSIILDVSCNISYNNNVTTASQNIYGFPASAYGPTGSSASVDLSSNTFDNYPSSELYNQGFYLDCSTNMIIRSSYFSGFSQNPNLYNAKLTMAQVNQSSYLPMYSYDTSYNFYADDISSNPIYNSLGSFTINNNNSYYSALVSGIYVLYQSPTFTITDLSLNNMGDYFYASRLVQYSSTGGVTITASETNLTHVTNYSNPLPSTISITNPSISSTISSSYNRTISLDISFNNIYSSSNSSPIATLNVIVDVSSNLLASSLTSLNDLGSSPQLGYRVWSAPVDYGVPGGGTMNPSGIVPFVYITSGYYIPNNTRTGSIQSGNNIGYVDVSYNNIWDISANSLANEELLIAAGNFTTNNIYYIDYSDMSGNGNQNTGIDYFGLSGTKFATFAWKISDISGNFNKINFQINFNGTLHQNSAANNFAFFDQAYTQQLLLFYRFEYNNNVTSTSWGSNGLTYYPNTTWISINSSTSNPNTIVATTICSYVNVLNVYWNTTQINNNPNDYNYTFTTDLPTISLKDATLYLRIGIPNNLTNNSFNNVYAYLSNVS